MCLSASDNSCVAHTSLLRTLVSTLKNKLSYTYSAEEFQEKIVQMDVFDTLKGRVPLTPRLV